MRVEIDSFLFLLSGTVGDQSKETQAVFALFMLLIKMVTFGDLTIRQRQAATGMPKARLSYLIGITRKQVSCWQFSPFYVRRRRCSRVKLSVM